MLSGLCHCTFHNGTTLSLDAELKELSSLALAQRRLGREADQFNDPLYSGIKSDGLLQVSFP